MDPDLRRSARSADAEHRHRLLRLLSRLLSLRPVRGEGLEDRQDRLYRRRQHPAAQRRPQRDEGRLPPRSTPSATVTGAFAGSFQDPAKGHEIASQMYQCGVDYIQTDSAATDTGIIQAANEGEGRMVSAISPAQYKIGPKTVAALVALDFGQSLYNEVSKALGPDFKGGHVHTGLGTGVIDFVLSPVFQEQGPKDLVAKAKEVWPDIEKAKADIISGALKVEFKTEL